MSEERQVGLYYCVRLPGGDESERLLFLGKNYSISFHNISLSPQTTER
jgi:hypothetical protein